MEWPFFAGKIFVCSLNKSIPFQLGFGPLVAGTLWVADPCPANPPGYHGVTRLPLGEMFYRVFFLISPSYTSRSSSFLVLAYSLFPLFFFYLPNNAASGQLSFLCCKKPRSTPPTRLHGWCPCESSLACFPQPFFFLPPHRPPFPTRVSIPLFIAIRHILYVTLK